MQALLIAKISPVVAITGMAVGAVVILIVVWCQARLFDGIHTREFAFSVLFGTSAFSVGMAVGFLASPADARDAAVFRNLSIGLIGAFSGYVAAKVVDPVVSVLLNKEQIIQNRNIPINATVIITMLALGFMFAYLLRTSFQADAIIPKVTGDAIGDVRGG